MTGNWQSAASTSSTFPCARQPYTNSIDLIWWSFYPIEISASLFSQWEHVLFIWASFVIFVIMERIAKEFSVLSWSIIMEELYPNMACKPNYQCYKTIPREFTPDDLFTQCICSWPLFWGVNHLTSWVAFTEYLVLLRCYGYALSDVLTLTLTVNVSRRQD